MGTVCSSNEAKGQTWWHEKETNQLGGNMDGQDVLINKLIDNHIYKLPDGRDLFEGSCEELAGLLKGVDEDDKKIS